jgi:hypothetical protein
MNVEDEDIDTLIPQFRKACANATPSRVQLSSVAEANEAPDNAQQDVSAVPSPSCMTGSKDTHQADSPAFKTPNTTSRFRPSLEEMHPSKVHRSTTKQPGPVLQSTISNLNSATAASQSSLMTLAIAQNTPTKLPGAWPHVSSPKFEFTVGQDDSILNTEAQRIMESVRGEAAKIKAQMHAERDKQDMESNDAQQKLDISRRKIAGMKGKPGRYSDAHKQEFQRMESIAGHASIWKNKHQHQAVLLPSKSGSDLCADVVETQLPRSISSKSLQAGRPHDSDRVENSAPGKRAKKSYEDDISSGRPLSRNESDQNEALRSTASKASLQTNLPSAITTPTKASLARAASVKQSKRSMIPSPSRRNLMQAMGNPAKAQSEGSKKYRLSLAKFGHMKSARQRRQSGLANDPTKEPAGRPLAPPEEKLRLGQALPSLQQLAQTRLLSSPGLFNHVENTPIAKSASDSFPPSPSPSRIPAASTPYKANASEPGGVSYPSIANSPNITKRVKIPTASAPGDFTFRSDKTMLFNPAAVAVKTPTIRRVRPSGISTPVAAFDPLPPIPHGLPNKKRRRADSDDEDIENTAPVSMTRDDTDEPRTKKLKSSPSKTTPGLATANMSAVMGSKIPQARGGKEKSKGRGVLSASRLNMLARPKTRR